MLKEPNDSVNNSVQDTQRADEQQCLGVGDRIAWPPNSSITALSSSLE